MLNFLLWKIKSQPPLPSSTAILVQKASLPFSLRMTLGIRIKYYILILLPSSSKRSNAEHEVPNSMEETRCYQRENSDHPRHFTSIASQKHGSIDWPAVGHNTCRQEQLRKQLVEAPWQARSSHKSHHKGAQVYNGHCPEWHKERRLCSEIKYTFSVSLSLLIFYYFISHIEALRRYTDFLKHKLNCSKEIRCEAYEHPHSLVIPPSPNGSFGS